MPLIDLNAEPSNSTRRWFGLSAAAALVLLAWLLGGITWFPSKTVAGFGALVGVVYYIVPKTQLAIIRNWQRATYPIAWVLGHAMLLTIYFGIVMPMGMIARVFGYDPLTRGASDKLETTWHDRDEDEDPSRSFYQY